MPNDRLAYRLILKEKQIVVLGRTLYVVIVTQRFVSLLQNSFFNQSNAESALFMSLAFTRSEKSHRFVALFIFII